MLIETTLRQCDSILCACPKCRKSKGQRVRKFIATEVFVADTDYLPSMVDLCWEEYELKKFGSMECYWYAYVKERDGGSIK